MSWLYTAIGYVLQFCYTLTKNYGLALLLFAFFFKLLLFPLGYKQQKNQRRMAMMRPKIAAIEKKYAGRNDQPTLRKKQMEIQELYQKEGINPMGGCLPMLLQFPIIIALYNVIRSPITYLMNLGKEGGHIFMNAVNELHLAQKGVAIGVHSELDAMGFIRDNWSALRGHALVAGKELPDFSFLGRFMDLTADPAIKSFDRYLLVPIITFITMYATMWLTQKLSMTAQGQTKEQEQSMAMMNLMMPTMSTIFTFSVPVAVSLYWLYQNIFGVLQQLILYKAIPAPQFTEEDFQRAEDELFGKNRKRKKNAPADPNRPRPRSLHHIDDDDYVVAAPKSAPAPKPQTETEKTLLDGVALKEDVSAPAPAPKKEKKKKEKAPEKEAPVAVEITPVEAEVAPIEAEVAPAQTSDTADNHTEEQNA